MDNVNEMSLEEAVVAWWALHRPIGWSVEMHAQHQNVNLQSSPEARELAKRAAAIATRATPPSPSTASEVDERAAFEAWWANQIESNGGASIGADYRHWAEKGFRAALASNPATTTEGAGVWQPIATMPADQFVLCAGELDGPGDWRIKMGTKEGGTGKIRLLGGSWEPKLWTSLPSKPSTPDRAAKPADSEAKV